MEQLWRFLEAAGTRNSIFTPQSVVLSLLIAFVLGQLLAWVYSVTHSGVSYSRSFVQSLILIAVAVSTVMAVIGDSIITAFGLMGALALVRFRNVIKDTRDVVFVFCALVIGLAAGSQHYALAVVGTVALCLIAIYLYATAFGSHRRHNAFLRFNLAESLGRDRVAPEILKRFCAGFALVSVQDDAPAHTTEYAYQLTIRDGEHNEMMISELEAIPGISDIHLTMQEDLLEV